MLLRHPPSSSCVDGADDERRGSRSCALLFAAVNRALCAALGPRALPLFGDEIGLHAVQVASLGLVGDPLPSRPSRGRGTRSPRTGSPRSRRSGVGPLNVNADEAAAALALGLGAGQLRLPHGRRRPDRRRRGSSTRSMWRAADEPARRRLCSRAGSFRSCAPRPPRPHGTACPLPSDVTAVVL